MNYDKFISVPNNDERTKRMLVECELIEDKTNTQNIVVTTQMLSLRIELGLIDGANQETIDFIHRHPNPMAVRKLAEKKLKATGALKIYETLAV